MSSWASLLLVLFQWLDHSFHLRFPWRALLWELHTELRWRPRATWASQFPDTDRWVRWIFKGAEQNVGGWLGITCLPFISIFLFLSTSSICLTTCCQHLLHLILNSCRKRDTFKGCRCQPTVTSSSAAAGLCCLLLCWWGCLEVLRLWGHICSLILIRITGGWPLWDIYFLDCTTA